MVVILTPNSLKSKAVVEREIEWGKRNRSYESKTFFSNTYIN